METPVIILGMGGHARVVADACLAAGRPIRGFVGPRCDERTREIFALPYLGADEVLAADFSAELLNGLGSVGPNSARVTVFRQFCAAGHSFATLLHPAGIVARSVRLGPGVQVMAGAVVQPGCVIGENTILNTRCSVDHDCRIGAHCHIAPGAVLSGGIELGGDVHVGAGAVIIQGIRVGPGALVGAGAVVIRDVAPGARVGGVPAKKL